MPVEMGMWRIDGDQPRRLGAATLPSESALEEFLERDPSLLGERLLVIGRQVPTAFGKFIDLLAMDADGNLHVLELKRDRTPREVVAQLLDYGSWVSGLGRDEVIEVANRHLSVPFEEAFAGTFDVSAPDEINAELRLVVVAGALDAASERIVTYLREFGVPINVVFFAYLADDDRRYLTRSWFATAEDEAALSRPATKPGKKAPWNGRDWFVSFGDGSSRSWDDALRYGFVSAGGGPFYSRTIRRLPVGARVEVHLPKAGYVAVGIVLDEAERFGRAQVIVDGDWVRLADQSLTGGYRHVADDEQVTEDNDEYIVPVRWIDARPRSQAYWEKGMFANENSACRLRQEFTLELLAKHFALDDSE